MRNKQRHQEKGMVIVPILLKDVSIDGYPIEQFVPLPRDRTFVSNYANNDQVHAQIGKAFLDVVENKRKHLGLS